MAITRQDLEEQRERLQNDIRCILDGLDDMTVDFVCEAIADRFQILIEKVF